jgi:hypothetical protein
MQFRKKILGGIAAILAASTLTIFASAISASDFIYNTTVKTLDKLTVNEYDLIRKEMELFLDTINEI